MLMYKLVAVKDADVIFEYPIPVYEKGDFTKNAAIAFQEFHKNFPEFHDPETDNVLFRFDKA